MKCELAHWAIHKASGMGDEATHDPCCTSHQKSLCCACYRRSHFCEVRPCCTKDAEAQKAKTIMDLKQLHARLETASEEEMLGILDEVREAGFNPVHAIGYWDAYRRRQERLRDVAVSCSACGAEVTLESTHTADQGLTRYCVACVTGDFGQQFARFLDEAHQRNQPPSLPGQTIKEMRDADVPPTA